MDSWYLGSIFRGLLTGVTIGHHPRREQSLALAAQSLASSLGNGTGFLVRTPSNPRR